MNLRSAANLIRNEYRERQTAADEAYRRAMEAHPELYAAEKAVRAAVLDGADNVAAESVRVFYAVFYIGGIALAHLIMRPSARKKRRRVGGNEDNGNDETKPH